MRFKQYILNEKSGPSATQWEELITLAWNKLITGGKYDDSLLKISNIKSYNNKEYLPIAEKIATKLADVVIVPTEIMKHYGSNGSKTTPFWKKITGKSSDTPKTDMIVGDHRISLKQSGGSQLMSGNRTESIATLLSTIEGNPTIMNKLIKEINSSFGKGRKLTSTKYGPIHKEIGDKIKNVLESDSDIMNKFVLETLTGINKFGKSNLGTATHMMVFSENGTVKYKKIDLSLAKSLSKSVNIRVSFKSQGGMRYSSLRAGIKENINETEVFDKIGKSILDIGKKIKSLIKSGFNNLLDYLGLSIDVDISGVIEY